MNVGRISRESEPNSRQSVKTCKDPVMRQQQQQQHDGISRQAYLCEIQDLSFVHVLQ
ncbi:hypothetical protein BC829DRAFT_396763 [Chytridium lagenaria]|nr:hypothetical protein BC829DRAFT_396763 [Chytridium lagenaria]